MPQKTLQVVVSFHTTAEALGFQKLAQDAGLAGRLAPIPRQMSAGCGFAWREPAKNEDPLRRLLEASQAEYEAIAVIEL